MAELTPGQKRTHDLARLISEKGGIITNYVNAQPSYSTHQIGIGSLKDRNVALKIAAENGFENVVMGKGNNISVKNPEYDPKKSKKAEKKPKKYRKKKGLRKKVVDKKRLTVLDHAINLRSIMNKSGFPVGNLNPKSKSLSFKFADDSGSFMKSVIELAGKEGYSVKQTGKKAIQVKRGPKVQVTKQPATKKVAAPTKVKPVKAELTLDGFVQEITFKYMETLNESAKKEFAQKVAAKAGLATIDLRKQAELKKVLEEL